MCYISRSANKEEIALQDIKEEIKYSDKLNSE